MKEMTTRLARADDTKFEEWLIHGSELSNPDPATVLYPSSLTGAVDMGEEPVLYQTCHPVLMLEALAIKPGLSTMNSARAINSMFEWFKKIARQYHMSEIYFLSSNPPLKKMVEKRGCVEVVKGVFKYRVKEE